MAIVCGIVDSVLEQRNYPLGAPWLYGDTQSDDNPKINGLTTAIFALITFQNIVPISLYISIEVVRTCQALFIYFDREMYYEKTDQPTLARSWNLSDDLGQIEYIFSDKTGTLTQNLMVFRQCTIAGRVYHGDRKDESDSATVAPALITAPISPPAKSSPHSSMASSLDTSSKAAEVKVEDVRVRFSDANLQADIEAAHAAVVGTPEDAHGRMLNGFWSVLALCHTALVSVDPQTNAIQYKAQSPDEAALVQAAADVGFVFRGRDREVLTLETPFGLGVERFELLNILDFTSARKRMSVIVRKLAGKGEEDDQRDGKVYVLCKGADNVIMERLSPGQGELERTTEDHLAEFASEGLRTLTLAYKVVPGAYTMAPDLRASKKRVGLTLVRACIEDEYEAWAARYHAATTSLDEREEKVEAVSDEIEQGLRLLGATAIEDRLQDGVPETIADLKEADIKIWVLTGDKLETAIGM